MSLARPCLLALLLILPGCEISRVTRPRDTSADALVTRTRPARAWALVEAGERLGLVVQFSRDGRSDEGGGASAGYYYSVRNVWHQELGTIDVHGRAFRFVPHEREAQWVATGTLVEGARGILGGGDDAELVDVSLEESAAPAPPSGH
jgi:hypothetical protein